MPYITLVLTAHLISRANEFIVRKDAPSGGSALSTEGVIAQISHHRHYQLGHRRLRCHHQQQQQQQQQHLLASAQPGSNRL